MKYGEIMKKIMFLGADEKSRQVIEYANSKGYITYGCSYLKENPIEEILHKYYCIDASDVDKISKVIEDETIAGVLSYGSDFLAVVQAKVAEKTGLLGNTVESVENLTNKIKFRKFLRENGFNDPYIANFNETDFDIDDERLKSFPMMFKPIDSAGSKGVTKVFSKDEMQQAYEFAIEFSPTKNMIVEKFVVSKHEFFIEGDVFVDNGKIIFYGVEGELRDNPVNPFLPMGTFTPNFLTEVEYDRVKSELQNLVTKIGFTFGGMNLEMIIDVNDEIYFVELAPRNGGNYISDQLTYAYGTNIKHLLVDAAMGENIDVVQVDEIKVTAIYVLHSYVAGKLKSIKIDKSIENKIIKKWNIKEAGYDVEYFEHAQKELGMFMMHFDNIAQLNHFLKNHNELVCVDVE